MGLARQQSSEIRVPRTRADLDALVARRGELQGQLRSAEDRRFHLAQQAPHTEPEARGTLNQRIAALDERIAQLENQVRSLDDAISAGLANPDLIHSADQATSLLAPPPAPPPSPAPEAVVLLPPNGPAIPINARNVLVGGLVTLSLFALVSWLVWRRAVAALMRNLRSSASSEPDVSRLQQSVDAIALEVERISENQRYVTKLLNQQTPGLAVGAAAEPVERMRAEQSTRRDR